MKRFLYFFVATLVAFVPFAGCSSLVRPVAAPVPVAATPARAFLAGTGIPESGDTAVDRIRLASLGYIKGGAPDAWWYRGGEPLTTLNARFAREFSRYNRALAVLARSSDPEAAAIGKRFAHPWVCLLTGPEAVSAPRIPGNDKSSPTRICVFPRAAAGSFSGALMYSERAGCVFAPGYDIPEPFLHEVLAHELGHRRSHLERVRLHKPEPDADGHAAEEASMHRMGMRLLNAESHGQLYKRLDGLIADHGPDSAFDAGISLTAADMQGLEGIFLKEAPSQNCRNFLAGFWMVCMGCRYADTKLGVKERPAAYRDMYAEMRARIP